MRKLYEIFKLLWKYGLQMSLINMIVLVNIILMLCPCKYNLYMSLKIWFLYGLVNIFFWQITQNQNCAIHFWLKKIKQNMCTKLHMKCYLRKQNTITIVHIDCTMYTCSCNIQKQKYMAHKNILVWN